jgi:lipoprotein-releasing system permease protein
MIGVAGSFWELLAAAGGTLALSFIVAIALGISALTVLFLGSSVVVLERFARAARSPWSVAVAGLVLAAVGGGLAAEIQSKAALEEGDLDRVTLWLTSSAVLAVGIAITSGLTWALLRWLRPETLGRIALGLLGLAFALIVGSFAQPSWALAPFLCAAVVLAIAAWRARRRDGAASEARHLLAVLTLALAVAVPIALLLSEPSPRIAEIGGSLALPVVVGVALGLLPLACAGLFDARRTAEWFIARRYLVAKRRQTFISVITAICVVGVAVGVWLIIVVLSVMNGFERTWREEIIGNRAHFTVHSGLGVIDDYRGVIDRVRTFPGVTGVAPYIDADGMVRGSAGEIIGVRVRGIDPALVGEVTDLPEDVVEGRLDDLEPHVPGGEDVEGLPGLVIGHALAAQFALNVGDRVLVVSPFGGPPTPLGPAPRLKPFRVAAVFKTSFFQWDEAFTYTSLAAAQDLRRASDVVDGVEVRVDDFYRSGRIGAAVREALGFPYFVRDWKEYFPSFFQALKTERVMMFVLLTMIMVVAAFVIVATLIMMIMEKTSDIAILKTMGASDASIERIFAIEGTLIGLVGTAVGVIAGVAVTTRLDWIQQQIETITGIDTLPASVYQFSKLPWEIDPVQIALVATIAMVLALGATLLPARQGAKLDPAEALRYE